MRIENLDLFETFKNSMQSYSKWNGINALHWSRYIEASIDSPLLDKKLTRVDLLNSDFHLQLSDIELSFAILSWGGMNRKHGKSLFRNSEWIYIVKLIRNLHIINRMDAYEAFYSLRIQDKLPGMGPAYFTKLICFLNPKLNGYIMDQWTAKSVNLLCDRNVVSLSKTGYVDSVKNEKWVYEEFCTIIDSVAYTLGVNGIDVEESMFSSGGKKKGAWRKTVIENWKY
jgi:hypothetical protein